MYTACDAWRNGVAHSTMDSNNGRAKHGGMGWRNNGRAKHGGRGGVMYTANEAWRNGVAQ